MNLFDEIIITPRLTLRKIAISDVVDMFDYTKNNIVSEHLSWGPHKCISETQIYISKIISEYNIYINCFTWGIILNSEDRLIGTVRIFDISFPNRRLEISYIMNPNYQGMGYITEAIQFVFALCKSKNINRIQARCTSDNYSSEKVMLKLGMSYEGLLIGFWVNKSSIRDAKMYALVFENEIKN
jgi:ribosomal-protein-alanine N-acetyltransferase